MNCVHVCGVTITITPGGADFYPARLGKVFQIDGDAALKGSNCDSTASTTKYKPYLGAS